MTTKTPTPKKTPKNKTVKHGSGKIATFALTICPGQLSANVNPLVILVDCSASMFQPYKGRAAYLHAQDAVRELQRTNHGAYIVGFSVGPVKLDSITDIRPKYMTNLAATLSLIADLNPRRVVVITDGYILDAVLSRAVIEVEMLEIDGIYIGEDLSALESLRELIAPGEIIHATPDQLGNKTLLLCDK